LATTDNQTVSVGNFLKQKVNDYKLLIKLKLSLLVVFSAFITFLLGATHFTWEALIRLSMGGLLVTGAANALNQVL